MEERSEYKSPERYFAASNSARGFKNYFDDIFKSRDVGRLFIIKGGPGTGKSRFMKEAAKAAEKNGYDVEYFYCSSDPDSLDGVLIGGGLCAITDGTPPHSMDPSYPGCVDEIIDLGAFWDEDALTSRRRDIIALTDKKKRAYRDAYRFLEASNLVSAEIRGEVYDTVDRKKMRAAVDRLFSRLPDGNCFEKKIRILNSVGMKGEVGFDTFIRKAKYRYYIIDTAETAYLMLAEIYRKAVEKKLPVYLSFAPVEPDCLDGIYFPMLKTAFCTVKKKMENNENEKTINMARFIKADQFAAVKGKVKFSFRCRDALLDEAKDRLKLASEAHFALEDIYVSAMDFDKKEKASEEYINKILYYCEKRKNMIE